MNSRLITVAVFISALSLGGCGTPGTFDNTMRQTADDAITVGINAGVGMAGGALAGSILCRRDYCRRSYTETGMLIGAAVGVGRVAQQERMRSVQQPIMREHCERVLVNGRWVQGNCYQVVDQTTIGNRPDWIPR